MSKRYIILTLTRLYHGGQSTQSPFLGSPVLHVASIRGKHQTTAWISCERTRPDLLQCLVSIFAIKMCPT